MSSMCLLAFLLPFLIVKYVSILRAEKKWECAPSGIACVERSWRRDGNGPVESWVRKSLGVCPTWVLWFGSPRGTQAEIKNFLFHWKPVTGNVLFFHDTLDVWRGCISQISCLKWTLGTLDWQWPSLVVIWSRWKGVEGHRYLSRIAVDHI